MNRLRYYLDILFPYIATLILWRMSSPLWNPCGVLAIIPIFYYSFCRPRDYFWVFALIGCFLIDSNFDSVLFWTTMYAITYSVDGFQSYIDLSRQRHDGLYIFMAFFGICMLISGIIAAVATNSFGVIFNSLWLFCWASVLYIPFAAIARNLGDRP